MIDFDGRQDGGSKVEIVRMHEEEMREYPSVEV